MTITQTRRTILADIHKNKYSKGYSLVTVPCPTCGRRHNHGVGEGHRIAHCIEKRTGRKLSSSGYFVEIDWSKKKNQELKHEYKKHLQGLTDE